MGKQLKVAVLLAHEMWTRAVSVGLLVVLFYTFFDSKMQLHLLTLLACLVALRTENQIKIKFVLTKTLTELVH